MAEHNWTPIRKGAIYCAPLCGGSCTWSAYQRAKSNARVLAKELGTGWKPRVHENLGWHFFATHDSGCCTVYRYGALYSAYLGPDQPGARWIGSGKTAKKAVADGVRQAKAELAGIKAVVEFVEGAL